MPYKTGIRLLGVARNPANGFPARLLDAWMLRNVSCCHHISRTCKMGPSSDPKAVVDQYCRVHGVERLRVVDASVMPDIIRANTNATAVLIGERAADFIKEQI